MAPLGCQLDFLTIPSEHRCYYYNNSNNIKQKLEKDNINILVSGENTPRGLGRCYSLLFVSVGAELSGLLEFMLAWVFKN